MKKLILKGAQGFIGLFIISIIMSYGSCRPEERASQVEFMSAAALCIPKTEVNTSSFRLESPMRQGVSWYWFDNPVNTGIKVLYYSGVYSTGTTVFLSRTGTLGRFVVDEKIDLGGGKALYLIEQERETLNGVYNNNGISANHGPGQDFRIRHEDCIDAFEIGDRLGAQVAEL